MAILGQEGGGQSLVRLIVLSSSGTWSPPWDCKAIVTVIGAGGGGGSMNIQGTNWGAAAGTGGGAGGLSQSYVDLKVATTYTLVVGAAGTAGYTHYDGVNTAAGAGGLSSFTDGSSVITQMVGNGGGLGLGARLHSTLRAGGTGGTATGGTIQNNTGGAAGSVTVGGGSEEGKYDQSGASGGGSIGLVGTGYASGTVTMSGMTSPTSGPTANSCSGGAGTGGVSANVASTSGAGTYSAGGGSGAASTGTTDPVAVVVGANAAFLMDGGAAPAATGYIRYAGAGAGGTGNRNANGGAGGGFGAGGGGTTTGNQTTISLAGNGGIGAGGGGSALGWYSAYYACQAGKGGAGIITIEILTLS